MAKADSQTNDSFELGNQNQTVSATIVVLFMTFELLIFNKSRI